MDIINVVSVVMGVNVKQWIESNDDDIQESLYWRQAFNCRTSELSVWKTLQQLTAALHSFVVIKLIVFLSPSTSLLLLSVIARLLPIPTKP